MKKQTKSTGIKVLLVVAVIIAGTVILWSMHRTTTTKPALTTKSKNPVALTKSTKKLNPDVTTPTPDPNVPGASSGSTSTDATLPHPPSGTFASNYAPAMNTSEYSSCNTTPQAICTINFKNTATGVTKSLSPTIAATSKDAQEGTALWSSWTPASIGLTPGTWQVSATATLNNQSQTTNSQLSLKVQS